MEPFATFIPLMSHISNIEFRQYLDLNIIRLNNSQRNLLTLEFITFGRNHLLRLGMAQFIDLLFELLHVYSMLVLDLLEFVSEFNFLLLLKAYVLILQSRYLVFQVPIFKVFLFLLILNHFLEALLFFFEL